MMSPGVAGRAVHSALGRARRADWLELTRTGLFFASLPPARGSHESVYMYSKARRPRSVPTASSTWAAGGRARRIDRSTP